MDLTVLHLAVPILSAKLQPTSAQLLWIVDIYGYMVAGFLITMGTLGDRIGRRRLLLIGAAAFGVVSIMAAYASSAEQLIAARALLGIAGATLAPSTLSLIFAMFEDPRQRATAVAVWISAFSAGSAVGPVLGGVLLEHFWWGSVFLLALPVIGALLVLGPLVLPEYRDPDAGRPDLVSAALSLTAVLALIYGLKQIAQDGVSAVPVVAMAAGVALGVAFVFRQVRLADPLIDLRLFRLPGFSASLATYGLSILVLFGGFLFLPQYLQLVLGLSPFDAGLWTLPWAVAFIVGSMATPALVRRAPPATVMAAGMVVAAAGFASFAAIDANTGFAAFATGTALFSLGLAPVFTLTTDLIIGSAPPERAGAASAISETSAEFGGALGIAVFGSIGIAVYRAAMAGAIPAGVPPDVAQAATATLGGTVAIADQLPARLGAELTGAGRAAFVQGLRLCAAISAAGSLGLAIFAALLLRGPRPGSDSPATPAAEHPVPPAMPQPDPTMG
jgi:DHA2 family multidrug resistance protein-like MFS transporter